MSSKESTSYFIHLNLRVCSFGGEKNEKRIKEPFPEPLKISMKKAISLKNIS